MRDFIHEQGMPFFAHLLGRLYDHFVRGFREWNDEVGVLAPPRTHSTMLALRTHGPLSVTELAALLRQSHPLVIKWTKQLIDLGLVKTNSDSQDRRRTLLILTPSGEAEAKSHDYARMIIERTYRRLMEEAGADVFDALWRIEKALRREAFADRLRSEGAVTHSNPILSHRT